MTDYHHNKRTKAPEIGPLYLMAIDHSTPSRVKVTLTSHGKRVRIIKRLLWATLLLMISAVVLLYLWGLGAFDKKNVELTFNLMKGVL